MPVWTSRRAFAMVAPQAKGTGVDIGDWLREQGLSQYEALFADNAVDYEVLPELSESDLEKLGIPLGHRKRLMKAIAKIGEAPAPPPPPPAPAPPPAKDEAERRPITVMFCDLVGSTSLSSKLDAEDWRELVGAYLDEASRAVASFGGHVLKKLGDGIMALFGYPQAQENDAERAARAGLAIFRALDEQNLKNVARGLPALAARIGLESGPVVVDQTGEVFGDAPNIAARVQAAAAPGTLLVTAGVHRQVAGLFVVEDKGPHELKGVTGKPNLYRIVRASGGGRRLGARSLTPLVGRDDELALLVRRWQRAREGEGQLIQIVGEPGLGKSRLMEEFRTGIAEAPHTWIEWSSSQLLQNTPLHPVAEWGRQRFGGADVPADQRLADLDATLAQVKLDPAEHTPLIAPLLDIPVPESRAAKLAPEEMRRRQLAAIVAWLLAGARTQPLALAFEDLHWADPTSLDLMKTLAERGAQAPMMIVATARPEFRAPWTTRSHHGILSLIPLDRAQIRKMVATLAERHALSKDTIEGLADRTGGVPLFVEEVTRLMLEGGAQTIPPTLQQSLAARLDRLGEAREVAQIGAVLGREFSYALLKSVAGVADPGLRGTGVSDPGYRNLDAALEKLVEADLLYVEGSPPSAIYRFKHALIQDAAYDSLLKNRRQALHRRAAEALVKNPEPQPELVAHHFTQSGQTEPAIEWWGKAGDAALRRSAFQEAISHLGKAIEMADKGGGVAQGKSSASVSQRIQLHSDLSQATMLAKGYTAPETKAAFAKLEEASLGSGAAHPNFAEFYARWVVDLMQGRHAKARRTAEEFLQAARNEGSATNIAAAHRALGWSCFALGELGPALSEYRTGLGLVPGDADDGSRFQFGMDTRGSAEIYRACAYLLAGDMKAANLAKTAAFARAETLDHVPTSVNVYLFAASASTIRRDAVAAHAEGRRVIELSQSHGLPQYLAYAEICFGWALARLGSPEAGLAMLRRAIKDQESQGSLYWRPWYLGLLAELELDATGPAAALELCDSALSIAAGTGEAWSDAALRALRGDILVRLDPNNGTAAEDAYLEALRIARAQGARTFELQAALALAKLRQTNIRPLDAHEVLAPALEGFAPTPEFPPIAEAQALLAELGTMEAVAAHLRLRQTRAKLHSGYALANMMTKGFSAGETQAALTRAGSYAEGTRTPHYWTLQYGRISADMMRGEAQAARRGAEAFIAEAESLGLPGHAAYGRRTLGFLKLMAGDFVGASADLGRVVTEAGDAPDEALHAIFGTDLKSYAESTLAHPIWYLGEFDEAARLCETAFRRASEGGQPGSQAPALFMPIVFAARCGRAERVLPLAERLLALAETHNLEYWRAVATNFLDWARGRLGHADAAESLRAARFADANPRAKLGQAWNWALLADLEAALGRPQAALAAAETGLAKAAESGEGWMRTWLLRLRGETLAGRDPAGAAAAYREAFDVAVNQGARAEGLLTALALAKLYQTTNRPLDAHDILSPALEGFAPTPEFPAIAEAQTLLAALAETPEVKQATGKRRSQAELYANYTRALSLGKGYGHAETGAAAAKAREASGASSQAHFDSLFLQTMTRLSSGDAAAASHAAETMLREAEAEGLDSERLAGLRMLGLVRLFQGRLGDAEALLTRALEGGERHDDANDRLRFLHDREAFTLAVLAVVNWLRGEFAGALAAADRARAAADALRHPPTLGLVLVYRSMLDARRGEFDALVEDCEALRQLGVEHGMPQYLAMCDINILWARARTSGDAEALDSVRKGLVGASEIWKHSIPFSLAQLAEAELGAGQPEAALASAERALAFAAESGVGCDDAWLHRLRGDALLRADPAAAEAAYGQAVEIAKAQGARTFQLQAALAQAKLYQTTNRPVEAHDALSPALEGFPRPLLPLILSSSKDGRRAGDEGSAVSDEGGATLTPDPSPVLRQAQDEGERGTAFPALAEAHALLTALAADETVAAELRQRDTRAKLHSGFALASMMTKGFASEDTKAALARAEAVTGAARTPQYWAVWYARINAEQASGDFRSARASAEAFIAEAEANGLKGHAAFARLRVGFCKFIGGELAAARRDHERALADHREEDDAILRATFSVDFRSSALNELGGDAFYLGEFEESERLIAEAIRRAKDTGPPISYVYALFTRIVLGAFSGRALAVQSDIVELRARAEALGLKFYTAMATSLELWTRARLGEPNADAFRASLGAFEGLGARLVEVWLQGWLSEVELAAGRRDEALAAVERGLELVDEMGYELSRPWFLLLRGDALADSDPAGAVAAYRGAIQIASAQGARPIALLAALGLAKVLASKGEVLEAHTTLSEALAGFSPTPLFPAIAEAQALLAALAADETVAAQLRQRQVRAKLHSGYALATMMTKGFAADETKAALARAGTVAETARTPQYWTVLYGRVGAALSAADLPAARAAAEAFLAEAESLGLKGHAAFARRAIGFQKLIPGDFRGAAADLRRALAETDDERDAGLSDLFGMDVVATAMAACAQAVWYLGEFDESARLTEAALARAQQSGRPVSWLHANANRLFRGLQGGQPDVVLEFAGQARALAEDHDLKYWKFGGAAWADWARARLGLPLARDFSGYLDAAHEMGVKLGLSLFFGMQADVELAAGRRREALEAVQRALDHGAAKGEAEWTTWLLRIRAAALADEDPQAAEASYREALEVAHQQGSPALALISALALAKFLEGRRRGLEAWDMLSPALEGFAPTPLLPAIAEAQALLAELAARRV